MTPSRSEFIKTSALGSTGLLASNATSAMIRKTPFKSKINVAILGSGLRGQSHIDLLLNRTDCHIIAVAEPNPKMLEDSKKRFLKKMIPYQFSMIRESMINSLIEHCKKKLVPPFDVYDAATWMAITPLSKQSIAAGSMPMPFPDFNRDRWIDKEMKFAFNEDY